MMNIKITSVIDMMFLLGGHFEFGHFALSRWEVCNREILVPGLVPAAELKIQYGGLRQHHSHRLGE